MRYRRTTRSGSARECAGDRARDRRTAARPVLRVQRTRRWCGDSRAPRKKARGPDEHHDDEEGERQHVTPFEVGEKAAQRNDFGEHEGCDEAADEIAEPAEYANQ